MVEIKTTIIQTPQMKALFSVAPNQYRRATQIWLKNEQTLFIGSRFRRGKVQRDLLGKKVSGTSYNWRQTVGNFFKGYVDETGGGMRLIMGANLKGKSGDIQESIAKMMESSYTQTSNENFLIPIYQNGVGLYYPRKLALRDFRDMLAEHKLFTVRHAGRIDFISNETRKIMFISTKTIHVAQQYNFTEKWEERLPGVIARGQKTIDRETENIAKGKYNV
jgi:hypothetical protein